MITKKYFFLNIILCLAVLFLAVENFATWSGSSWLSPEPVKGAGEIQVKQEISPLTPSSEEPAAIQSYAAISDRNIFSPERKDFPLLPAALAEAPKITARPQIVLYGVAIAGDFESATVSNSGRPPGSGERETVTVKFGQKIADYTLAKIFPDRIALENNGDRFEVLLNDSQRPKRVVQARVKATPTLMANLQPAPGSSSGEESKDGSSVASAERPNEPVRTPVVSAPANRIPYEAISRSARSAAIRGRMSNNVPPASSTQ
jgi:hypothetical protein